MGVKFLIAQAVLHNEGCSLHPDIAVMPRLVPAREQKLTRWVPFDKAVFRAVLVKPGKHFLVHVLIHQVRIVLIHQIDGQTQLMFTGAGEHDDLFGLLGRFLIFGVQIGLLARQAHTCGDLAGLAVEQVVLIGIGTVGRRHIDRKARVAAILQHFLKMRKGCYIKELIAMVEAVIDVFQEEYTRWEKQEDVKFLLCTRLADELNLLRRNYHYYERFLNAPKPLDNPVIDIIQRKTRDAILASPEPEDYEILLDKVAKDFNQNE